MSMPHLFYLDLTGAISLAIVYVGLGWSHIDVEADEESGLWAYLAETFGD